jgi:hypothetical protein
MVAFIFGKLKIEHFTPQYARKIRFLSGRERL